MSEIECVMADTTRLVLPADYLPRLGLRETEHAIKFIKDRFEAALARELNLTRVTAPLFVLANSGVNDTLTGREAPISFCVADLATEAEVVQSLAKWKRLALADYGFGPGEGLYTDMNAIRPNETLDNLHSLYVDQWDWELVMTAEERRPAFLKRIVRKIYKVIRAMERAVCTRFPQVGPPFLPARIAFVTAEELAQRYSGLAPRAREDAICQERGAVFIMGIGAPLSDGQPHDLRAPDYDDWTTTMDGQTGLNGDILVWYPVLGCAMELSSMGIRVDQDALRRQLAACGEQRREMLYYHRRLLRGELPLSIGGGIGQSRLCMLYLRKAHIGEVQAAIWPKDVREACRKHGIPLL
ncbi:MAG: aspartate--ammonia ligase [bacterium]|jgi:aspartate--ammonia ligase|nr:aspartate--ammonia ligase [bacterium]